MRKGREGSRFACRRESSFSSKQEETGGNRRKRKRRRSHSFLSRSLLRSCVEPAFPVRVEPLRTWYSPYHQPLLQTAGCNDKTGVGKSSASSSHDFTSRIRRRCIASFARH